MSARIPAFITWSLAAACAVYWAMRLLVAPAALPAATQAVSVAGALNGDVRRLLASPVEAAPAPAPVAALASRFRLVGVMAPREGERGRGQGIALIAVDGKPPRAFRIGAALDEQIVLLAVAPRSASLGPAGGAPLVQLDMTPLTPPATGVRSPGVVPGGGRLPGGLLRPGVMPGVMPTETAPPAGQVEVEPAAPETEPATSPAAQGR